MTTKEHEKVFKALANKRRLDILAYLLKNKEATVGEIAGKIKLSFKATSKHLLMLRNAGFIDKEQRSLLMYYSIARPLPPSLSRLISNL
jgi:DNA-binding transcriptional ArsR family regulator